MLLFKKFIFLILFLLYACGFEPLYYYQNNHKKINEQLAQVYILPIEGRVGQLVRNNLRNRMTPYGLPMKPFYELQIEIDDSSVKQSIGLDNTATRETIIFKAIYQLIKDKEIIVEGESTAEVSYSILTMPYGTVVSQKDVIRRAANILADDIALRISVYFKNIE